MRLVHALTLLCMILIAAPPAAVRNGGFETGSFDGWTADPNWVVANDSRVYYSGWQGKYWAWSGGKGEPATGKLRSEPFVLDKPAVRMMISGWDSVFGTGSPRKWNYVTLNLENGKEIDRVYAPNTTAFVPAFLDGSKHRGKRVYIEAVDDADQPSFAMLCIDDVRTADLPAGSFTPAPALPAFSPKKSLRLQSDACLIEVSKSNGSLTRIRDKKTGLDLILEPRLGGSYRFALMVPGKEPWQTLEANWIFGRDNKLSSYSINGRRLTLRWNGPLRNYLGATFRASVTETIELTGGGAIFNMSVDNKSNYHVGEVYFPLIGGVQGLGKTHGELTSTEMVRPTANDTYATANIFYVFGNMAAFGDQGPEQFFAYPEAQPEPWVGFASPKARRAVYVGAHDPANRKQVIRVELKPSSSGAPREDGNWPRPEELKGLPCGVELSFVEIADFPGHKVYRAAPVFLKFVDSDKKELRRVFTEWNATKH